jgi:hypothetical protein
VRKVSVKLYHGFYIYIDIWTKKGWSDRRVEKIAWWGASWFVLFAKYN